MMSNTERKDIRLVARTSAEIQDFIQRAADHLGRHLSISD